MRIVLTVTLVLAVVGVTMCGIKVYELFDEFPEQALFDNLSARYADLIIELDNAIAESDSAESLVGKLENINYPPETLFVALQNEQDDTFEGRHILKRIKRSSTNVKLMVNNGGYGRAGNQHFWIFHYPIDAYEFSQVAMLFDRPNPDKQKGPVGQ